jgi:hypothetical protein
MADEFVCSSCGATHPFPTFAWDYPLPVLEIPASERGSRVQLAPDECIIDDAEYFVRGCIQIAVHGSAQPFIWGVWAKVSEDTFFDCREDSGSARPLHGILPCVPPVYQDSQPEVEIKPRVGLRPLFTVLPATHPIALHQSRGLSSNEVAAIAEKMLHHTR